MKHLIIGTLLALAALSAMAADIYTWKDADGRVHFSDQPPTGKEEVKKLRGAAPSAAADAATETKPADAKPGAKRSQADRELEFRRRRAETQEAGDKAAKEKIEAERKAADCQSARNQLRALETGQRVSRFNDKGEAIPMDDSQRQAEIERTRQSLRNCP
ncbi:MAG: DUF4124 domain-containing protein [Rhodocyclaceae bacterium]|nr:DUF4124 domain-containing protein [Rhodocyclaceae bacterium]